MARPVQTLPIAALHLCFQYGAGVKALNKTHFSNPSHASGVGDGISFVTVFTIYNNSLDTLVNSRSSNLVAVGNSSYSKSERSMAILNVFINYIQVILQLKTMQYYASSFHMEMSTRNVNLLEVSELNSVIYKFLFKVFNLSSYVL